MTTRFFAVYDGHDGRDAVEYTCKHLHRFVVRSPYYPLSLSEALKDAFHVRCARVCVFVYVCVYVSSVNVTFPLHGSLPGEQVTEDNLLSLSREHGWQSGTTAVTMLLQGDRAVIGHAGDSRAGQCFCVFFLSPFSHVVLIRCSTQWLPAACRLRPPSLQLHLATVLL